MVGAGQKKSRQMDFFGTLLIGVGSKISSICVKCLLRLFTPCCFQDYMNNE